MKPAGPGAPAVARDPRKLAAVLLIFVLIGGIVLAWRYVAMRDRTPQDYYSFQISRWEDQLVQSPEDPVIWTSLGGLYDEAGRNAEARRAYTRALELDDANPAAHLYFAREARQEREFDDARSHVQAALDALPEGGRALAYYELGSIEETEGRVDEAIAAYEDSVADRSTYFNSYEALARLYESAGRYDEALEAALLAERFALGRPDLAEAIERLRSMGASATIEAPTTMNEGQ